ncbi:MAG: aminotransferase class V-fold PLP-dependent enzyme, partial [Planctomycetota bacterium]
LGCDYYAASCHKWLSAPAGTGFLYVSPEAPTELEPLCASRHGTRRDLLFIGTEDYSRYLAIPAAIDFIEAAGIEGFRARTHELARYAMGRIGDLTGLEPWLPDGPDWYASMIALPLPECDPSKLCESLWQNYRIEPYLHTWNDRPLVRVSCHLYTQAAEIDRLARALEELEFGRTTVTGG